MRRSTAPFVALSLALHGALAGLPKPAPARRGATPRANVEVAAEVELELRVAAASPAPAEEAMEGPPRIDVRPSRAAPRASRAARPRQAGAAPSSATQATAPSPAQAPPPDTLPSLSPRAVAEALVGAAQPADDAGTTDSSPTPAQRLNRAIAAGVPSHVDTIPDPVLKPSPRGGYVYEGHGFDAIIRPDGSVDMRDRYGSVHLPLVPFRTASGEWRVALLGGTFKLYEWLERKLGKSDPFRSERRWFLDRTRALREKMALDRYGKGSGLTPPAAE